MAKLQRVTGSTSHVLTLFIQDSSSTTGAGLTGLAFGTSGLTAYYKRNTGSASVAVTLANITTLGTYVSGGFKEVDAANMPGVYEFHPPDAAYAAGAKSVVFMLKGATNMAPVLAEIELTAVDNQDGVRYGMTALPASGTLAVNPTLNATQAFNNTGQTTKLAATIATGDLTDLSAARAAKIDNLDAAVTTRMATFAYTAPDNAGITAIKAKTDNLPGAPAAASDIPTATANADALLDRANGIETGWTFRQVVRLIASVLLGESSNGNKTFRDLNDTKDRVTATVDGSGNRTAVTKDAS